MKLIVAKGVITLPDDFEFQIESNHPFFSDEGTAAIPVSIPSTKENLRILGNPDNIRNAKRQVLKLDAQLQTGAFQKNGRLIIDSASGRTGIAASFMLEESDLYSQFRDRKIRDIFEGLWYYPTKSMMLSPTDIYNNNYTPLTAGGKILTDLVCFPVAVKREDNKLFVINEPDSNNVLKGEQARTVPMEDGSMMDVPAYYGLAYYIYLWALIEHTFTLSGFTVKENVFKSDPLFYRIVVVHNVADGLIDPENDYGFSYARLVPSMTVGELIEFLANTFCAVVLFEDREVSIVFMRDIFNATPDMDLSGYESGDRMVTYPDASRLELTMDTSLESAAPAADTIDDFNDRYKDVMSVASLEAITAPGIYFIPVLNKYYVKEQNGKVKLIGSDCFKYSRRVSGEAVEISSPARFLPMVLVDGRYMPFIGSRVHVCINAGKDADADQPVQLCYAFLVDDHFCGSSYSYNENGTPQMFMVAAVPRPKRLRYTSLTPEGLARYIGGSSDYGLFHLFSPYESLLVNSAPEIDTAFDIPIDKFLQIDRDTVKLLDGARVLFKSMSYTLRGDSNMVHVTAKLQLLPEYVDAVEVPDKSLPSTTTIKYAWKLYCTREVYETPDKIKIAQSDGLTDYSMDDAPQVLPTSYGSITMLRLRWLQYWDLEASVNGGVSGYGQAPLLLHSWVEFFMADYV